MEDAISGTLNESACKNIIHELEVIVNDLCYHNKMDDNNGLDNPSESDTCSEDLYIEVIVDTIRKSNVDDKVEDDNTFGTSCA